MELKTPQVIDDFEHVPIISSRSGRSTFTGILGDRADCTRGIDV